MSSDRPDPRQVVLAPTAPFAQNGVVEQLVAVVVVVFRGDRVLTMQRSQRREAAPAIWESVSGRVQRGEDPRDAAAREAREETGLPIAIGMAPVDAYAMARSDQPMVVIVYRGDAPVGEVARSAEHDAHEWLALDQACARMPPRLAQAARAAHEGARAGVESTETVGGNP